MQTSEGRRINGRLRVVIVVGIGVGVASIPAGCITGHEAEEAMAPDPAAELEEAKTLEEIGAISETTYELKKDRIESEE